MKSKDDYIAYKLNKADDSMRVAKVLLHNHFYPDALSKIYYAAFYAVSALLADKRLQPKTHAGVKSLFHKEFILTKLLDKNFGKLYDTLLAKRFEADYELYAFIDDEEIPSQLEQTQKLIDIIKEKLQHKQND